MDNQPDTTDERQTLTEIQERLWATPIPDKYVKEKTKGGQSIAFVNWRVYVRHFDAIAPGWEMRVSEPAAGEAWHKKKDGNLVKVPTVTVCVHVTIHGRDGSRTVGSMATVEVEDAEWGLPPDKAQWMAMKKAMRVHGLVEPEAMRKAGKAASQPRGEGRPQQQRQERPAQQRAAIKQEAHPAGADSGEDAGATLTQMMKELNAAKGDPAAIEAALKNWDGIWDRLPEAAGKTAKTNWDRFSRILADLTANVN